jgi:phosphate ABC transporter phosphate-binding protein
MPAPATISELRTVIEQSGLLSEQLIRPWFETKHDQPLDQCRILWELVQEGLLTPFQSKQLERGRYKGFFLTEKYKVLDFIGSGGMGKVYLCEHLILHRLVAVKLLQISQDKGSKSSTSVVERFYREARAVAALDDPNIVRVFDVDRLGSHPFMVMEYVDGTNLHELVAKHGPLPQERTAHYIKQAAMGLQHAHDVGLIHRDIKPGNILVDRNGLVKLLDLGLARFAQDPSKNLGITTRFDNNAVMGTVDFMAPEQVVDSSKVDIRSDIYSLGCTMYYVLTGQVPFPDLSIPQKMYCHQSRAPEPVSSICPNLSVELIGILDTMMAKEPKDRYQTPIEVADALKELTKTPISPPFSEEMPEHPASFFRLGLSPSQQSSALLVTPSPGNSTDTLQQSLIDSWHVSNQAEEDDSIVPLVATDGVRQRPSTSNPVRTEAWPGSQAGSSRKIVYPLLVGALLILAVLGGVWGLGGFDPKKEPDFVNNQLNQDPPNKEEPPAKKDIKSGPFVGVILNGGGSTFVAPVMSHWAQVYEKGHGVRVDYRGVGSGKGVSGVLDRVFVFGCTDAVLDDQQLARVKANGGEIIHIPLVMGAVVPCYNLPDVTEQLRFTGPVLADIYLGKITRWNDPSIRINNPGIDLPDMPITPVRRQDSSGTTHIWSDYLTKTSAQWEQKIGPTKELQFPNMEKAEGNRGVADLVSRRVGSIGYVELTYALQNNLCFGLVRNRKGNFVHPSLEGVSAAATASLDTIPDDLRFSLTNAPGDDSYPIAGTAWAVVFINQSNVKAAPELVAFLRWITHEGQAYVKDLQFVPLPQELIKRIDAKLDAIQLPKQR